MSIKTLFFDSDCLSAFLWVGQEKILEILYSGKMKIPKPVYDELSNPRIVHLKNRIDALLDKKIVDIINIETDSNTFDLYMKLTTNPEKGNIIIGKGEAAAISLAKEFDGILASNNLRDILSYVRLFNLEYITTGEIMKEALEKGIISEKLGNNIWANMLAKRRRLGANTFSDYIRFNK